MLILLVCTQMITCCFSAQFVHIETGGKGAFCLLCSFYLECVANRQKLIQLFFKKVLRVTFVVEAFSRARSQNKLASLGKPVELSILMAINVVTFIK